MFARFKSTVSISIPSRHAIMHRSWEDFTLTAEVRAWLNEHIGPEAESVTSLIDQTLDTAWFFDERLEPSEVGFAFSIMFTDKSKAALFKLTWL